jgi:hypothetical protein
MVLLCFPKLVNKFLVLTAPIVKDERVLTGNSQVITPSFQELISFTLIDVRKYTIVSFDVPAFNSDNIDKLQRLYRQR